MSLAASKRSGEQIKTLEIERKKLKKIRCKNMCKILIGNILIIPKRLFLRNIGVLPPLVASKSDLQKLPKIGLKLCI